jgi:hypothetical protein
MILLRNSILGELLKLDVGSDHLNLSFLQENAPDVKFTFMMEIADQRVTAIRNSMVSFRNSVLAELQKIDGPDHFDLSLSQGHTRDDAYEMRFTFTLKSGCNVRTGALEEECKGTFLNHSSITSTSIPNSPPIYGIAATGNMTHFDHERMYPELIAGKNVTAELQARVLDINSNLEAETSRDGGSENLRISVRDSAVSAGEERSYDLMSEVSMVEASLAVDGTSFLTTDPPVLCVSNFAPGVLIQHQRSDKRIC